MTTDTHWPDADVRYVGFWARFVASILDSILLALVLAPVSLILFGSLDIDDAQRQSEPAHLLLKLGVPMMAVLIFWMRTQSTPGKMVVHARIVDADSGADPTPWQFVLRYLGYLVSIITIGLGFVWVAFDARKQGFHDKIASTVVVHAPRRASDAAVPG